MATLQRLISQGEVLLGGLYTVEMMLFQLAMSGGVYKMEMTELEPLEVVNPSSHCNVDQDMSGFLQRNPLYGLLDTHLQMAKIDLLYFGLGNDLYLEVV